MADVLPASSPHRGASPYLTSPQLPRKRSPPSTLVLDPSANYDHRNVAYYQDSDFEAGSETSSEPSSPRINKSSVDSTPPSSISLDQQDDDDDEELYFPSYGDRSHPRPHSGGLPPPSPAPTEDDLTSTSPSTPDNESPFSPNLKPADDTAVHDEPSRQVDYLSHDWREEDIWQSWRHIVSNRKTFGERSRLENASWRTWTKSKYRLRTVSPERLNWLKDCDVTWLYGPLQEGKLHTRRWRTHDDQEKKACYAHSEPASRLSKTDSFLKKPILKKRSVSEVMLQKSLSSSSLVKQAAAAVQAQRTSMSSEPQETPHIPRSASSASHAPCFLAHAGPTSMMSSQSVSGLQSPENGARRHIRFDDTVEQCIAVDFKPGDSEEDNRDWSREADVSSSEDDLIMMKQRSRRPGGSPNSRRDSLGQESKGIVMLPSTTLKYHHDEPYCPGHPDQVTTASHHSRLQHSSSQETLRPPRSPNKFSLEDDTDDVSWEPSGAFSTPRPGSAAGMHSLGDGDPTLHEAPAGLRRTASGMFMPLEDEDEPAYASTGVFGRVVDTVNTARDIFSVIVNVGWRS